MDKIIEIGIGSHLKVDGHEVILVSIEKRLDRDGVSMQLIATDPVVYLRQVSAKEESNKLMEQVMTMNSMTQKILKEKIDGENHDSN